MAWFSYDRNAFLAFLYGRQVCIVHCGYDFNLYFSSSAALVVLSTAEVAENGIKVFQGWSKQQSETTWCPRWRRQVCPSSLPGWARDCSSSLRSSYHRESQQAALHWGNDSSFKRSDLSASDCLGTTQRTFVLHWLDPVQTVISLPRVSYSKENKESQENLLVVHSGKRLFMIQLEGSTGKCKGSMQLKMAFDLCYIFISFSSVSGKNLPVSLYCCSKRHSFL